MSYPTDALLNDDVSEVIAPDSYSSFDEALVLLRHFGQGALLAKADIKPAFCLLPVHPQGFILLVSNSRTNFILINVCPCSPVGGFLHYLDDFLFIGPEDSHLCLESLNVFFHICDSFGIPIAHEKTFLRPPLLNFWGLLLTHP